MTVQEALAHLLVSCRNASDDQIYDAFRRLSWDDQEAFKEILFKAGFLTPTELQQYDVLLILRKIAHHFSLSEFLVSLILEQNLDVSSMVKMGK